MNEFTGISVVIPVREGSSRLKKKFFLPYHEKLNLVEWKIDQLKRLQSGNRIFLSSNSIHVKAIADNMGVEFIPPKSYLSTGHDASLSEVIKGVINDLPTEHFAWVTVVLPLMKPSEYREAFQFYLSKVVENKIHDSLVSVNLLKEYFWSDEGPLNYRADRHQTISKELPNIYRVTNGLYMRNKEATLAEGYFLGSKPFMYQVSKISSVDIDGYEGYQISLAMKEFYDEL
ncbi:cytidylyltransferase domain-containing protein [Microbulbifer sp. TRSA005]|uniref:cytidylyltransferase domain-containing protein n=1 Tax=Microbulbifer sp. TRSA005 TaxID=3243383 RepID=UPI004039DADA